MGPETNKFDDYVLYAINEETGEATPLGSPSKVVMEYDHYHDIRKFEIESYMSFDQFLLTTQEMKLVKVKRDLPDNFIADMLKELVGEPRVREFTPERIIQNGPAFIVFWNDGTKSVLKRKDSDQDDPYAAFGQALMIKIFGTNSMAHKIVDRRYEKHEKEDISVLKKDIIEKVKGAIERAADGLSFGFYSDNKCCFEEKDKEVTEDGRSESDGSGLS